MNPANQTNQTPNRNKGKWTATIIIFVVVLIAEFFLFHKYSLWFQEPSGKNTVTQGRITPSAAQPSGVQTINPAPGTPAAGQNPIQTGNPANSGSLPPQNPESPAPDGVKPPMPADGSTRDIVSMEGIKLMEKAPRFAYLKGIVELESNTSTLMNPEREKKLLEALQELKKNSGNKEALDALEPKTREMFFSGINQTQVQIIESKMAAWENEVKNLSEEELLKYREKSIDESLNILQQRTGPVK
ncbi:MAG: hypothetical protein LWY06_04300 [Firmicutes bacterium]|nr:hypothetical protein [Bacillota bacterium]